MKIDLQTLLERAQGFIAANYAAALSDRSKRVDLLGYIEQYIREKGYEVEGYSQEALARRLFSEMAEYSILTPLLERQDIEEININSWDDVALTLTDGKIVKLDKHFLSPKHAVDICKRLLQHSGMVIDNAMPVAQGHLPGNTRITVVKEPIVDPERGISASIRLLHPSLFTCRQLISGGTATEEMVEFLCSCLRYGVSLVIAGATRSGKTTLMNALLQSIPDAKRIFTIESGSRELSLVREDSSGRIRNNVVHTLSRPSDNPAHDISQEDLVVYSLRFSPDVVVVGEMRDTEAFAAVEAAMTGHTVVSTVHAGAAESAHWRLAELCQKRFPMAFDISLLQAARAFPIVCYEHKLDDNSRRIVDISECVITPSAGREYHTLYRYVITKSELIDGQYVVDGHFEAVEKMSQSLRQRFLQSGMPTALLQRFLGGETK